MEPLRKKLLYRSKHRGMQEADIIVGNFAQKHVLQMDEDQLKVFEGLLELPDQDLLNWCMGLAPLPLAHHSAVMKKLIKYVKDAS